jgi:hypothetical protein
MLSFQAERMLRAMCQQASSGFRSQFNVHVTARH